MNQYRTHDLPFAAYLMTVEVEMLDPEREGGRVFFVFRVDDQDWFDQHRRAWTNDTARIPPQKFSQCMRSLKVLVHDVLRQSTQQPEPEVYRRR